MADELYWVGDKPMDRLRVNVTRNGVPLEMDPYTGATITLTGPDDLAIDTTGTAVQLVAATVQIIWPTDRSLFTAPGWYTLQIGLLGPDGSLDQLAPVQFQVGTPEPVVDPAWADSRDVLKYAGVEVTAGQLMQAQGVIELEVGVSYAATLDATRPSGSALSGKDRRLLRQAVAYQAAFIAQHEAVFSRAAAASVNQDGMAVSVADPETGWTLAPLARRALRQVSWRHGDRTTRIGPHRPSGSLERLQDAWVRDEAGLTIWQPIGTLGRFDGLTTERGA